MQDAKISKDNIDKVIIFGRSTRIPFIQNIVQKFFEGKQIYKKLNPHESAAYGAAIQAGILSGVKCDLIEKVILLDVIPFSLGIETEGGIMKVFIPRNSTILFKKTEKLSTSIDYQTTITVKIYEGEKQLTKDNQLLGQFVLDGIKPMVKGQPKIEVKFDFNESKLTVIAADKLTGNSKNLTNPNDKNLSKQQIDRLVIEAEQYKKEDNLVSKGIENENT